MKRSDVWRRDSPGPIPTALKPAADSKRRTMVNVTHQATTRASMSEA